MLNQNHQPAIKKLLMLPSVLTHLNKSELQTAFMDCGVMSALTVCQGLISHIRDQSGGACHTRDQSGRACHIGDQSGRACHIGDLSDAGWI